MPSYALEPPGWGDLFPPGAEDYFLSAYYFNEGEFKTPNSGLTVYDGKGTLSAYKVHDRDPILFDDGLQLVFRNMESTTGCGDMAHCPNQYCKPGAGPDARFSATKGASFPKTFLHTRSVKLVGRSAFRCMLAHRLQVSASHMIVQ